MINPIFLTDSYKLSHKSFEIDGVENIYSNFTPRFSHYFKDKYPDFDDMVVNFGQQYLVQKLHELWDINFFKQPKEKVINEAKRILLPYIGMDNLVHFEKLHDLGYLPIKVKSLPEGVSSPIGIPILTITNTHSDFEWLVNYLETFISVELWKPVTVATIAKQFRKLSDEYAVKTTGDKANAMFQLHDFSFRGQSGWESSAISGAAFLTNSHGTDNVPAIIYSEQYYNANIDNELIAGSVPASEHSVTTLGIINNTKENSDKILAELKFLKEVITQKFPTGIVSYVSDSYDYWSVVNHIIPVLKSEILARDGKLVLRPDSGNPVKIICGHKVFEIEYGSEELFYNLTELDSKFDSKILNSEVVKVDGKYRKFGLSSDGIIGLGETISESAAKGTIQCLWETFGGTINEQGYKVLDSHIGLIYGDGITYQRAKEIFEKLESKGFATTNVVFGIGSYSLAMLSRDDLGFAIKATNAIVNGESVAIYKDPKTDSSKKSAKGLLYVGKNENGSYYLEDNVDFQKENQSELQVIYEDGKFYNQTSLQKIRKLTGLIN